MSESPINDSWSGFYEKGRQLFRIGKLQEAVVFFQEALRRNPCAFEAHHDLGAILFQIGRYPQALSCFEQAVGLNPRSTHAWLNGGNTLRVLQRLQEAIQWYQKAVALNPRLSDAHYNLGRLYQDLGLSRKAIPHYQAAIDANPQLCEAYNNLGAIWLKAGGGGLDDAGVAFKKAIRLRPGYIEAIYNLSVTYKQMGRIMEAVRNAHRVLQLQPDHGGALALLITLLQQLCDWPALSRAEAQLEALTQKQLAAGQRPDEQPFLSFARAPDAERNLRVAAAWSRWLTEKQIGNHPFFDFSATCRKPFKVTIGYVSEQFRNAATAHLMAGLFAHHDRRKFNIIAYSTGADDGSYYRKKIERDVDLFLDISSFSDKEAAEQIYHDKVGILVDLGGWMHGHRLGIFAQRPAPVQVTYLGYPGSTGAHFMDYILADPVVIPEHQQLYYSEKVIYLPHCYQVTDPEAPVDARPLTRRDCGLPARGFVFCSFNTDYKIEADAYRLWMNILRRVPGSVLWLLVNTVEARRNLRHEADRQGVDPERILFAAPLPKANHLARLKLADLGLDTFTVNGHTTTSDALLADVPVITMAGRHFASRVAASILISVGLEELIVNNFSEYENLATTLAHDPKKIGRLKQKLRSNKKIYPLFNTRRFVRNLEVAYTTIWERYLSGLPPKELVVREDQLASHN